MRFRQNSGAQQEMAASRSPEEARARIHDYAVRSRRGQWGLFAFLGLSLAALRWGGLLTELPGNVRTVLGAAPPVKLMNVALAVYAFSALIYILARMMEGDAIYRGWTHLGYLGGFYIFFGYAGALRESFWAILVAGLTIFGLEHFRHWSHCRELIRQEHQLLAEFSRGEHNPLDRS